MPRVFLIPTVLTFVMAIASVSYADRPVKRDHDVTVDDYFTIGVITGCAVSPDGRYVAYAETRWEPPAKKRNTDLWVVECSTKAVRRLTFDRAADGSPRWSPDGRFIYFTSNRKRYPDADPPYDGKKQVWRTSPAGGAPFPVTRVSGGIGLFDLSRDGQTLYYTVLSEEVDDEWKSLREKYEDLEYGHGVTGFSQVWKLGLANWRAKKLIDDRRVIREMVVSPDETRVAMITTPNEELITNEGRSRVDVYDVTTKDTWTQTDEKWRADHPSPYGWLEGLSWSADSGALAFTISYDGYQSEVYVAQWAGGQPTIRKLERPESVSVAGGSLEWRGRSRDLCFLGEERARRRVYCIEDVRGPGQGDTKTLTSGDVVVTSFGYCDSGEPLVAVLGTTEHPRDLFLVPEPDRYERLTRVNPQVDAWKLPQISLVRWKGADGDEVEGVLELPPDYKPGDGPLPMIVEIHGGPTAATLCSLRFWIYGRTLMAAKGYALLSPNYRGSTGYGDRFMTGLIGHENDIEVRDILTGVDAMIERGIADPERLGVMGWSNGGFLTNCLITRTERFKAASSGAGLIDLVMHWSTEDTPGHVINYMQGLPWKVPEAYRAGSPLYNLHKVRTPTLIHVGEHDARHTPTHSRALYRALRHYLKVPTELVVYPDEGHVLTTYEHRKAKMEWDLAWFERYLQSEPRPQTETRP